MNTRDPRQAGFTLVELLIVVVILGILAAVVIPQFGSTTASSRESALKAQLTVVRQAIEIYKAQHGDTLPTANIMAQLTGMTDAQGNSGTKYGPYLRQWPSNPVVGADTVRVVATMPATPTGTEAWLYATSTGDFRVNHPGTGPSGTPFFGL